jgi:hypothetical protein
MSPARRPRRRTAPPVAARAPAVAPAVVVALGVALALAGCAQPRLEGRLCPLKMLPVEVAAVEAGGVEADGVAAGRAPPSYRAAVEAALASPRGGIEAAGLPEHLVLSGGGKWGAFGAGFLAAWPGRPVFGAVTGVSTGALQSTFAFLADEAVAADRAYPAALDLALPAGAPQPGHGRRYIDDLPLAYTFRSAAAVVDVRGGEITALRQGSAATFGPLRQRLDVMIDAETLRRVAVAGARGRGLFVGLVDMDDGRAVAVDMTHLAQLALAEPPHAERYRQCYIDVLVAASSEPLAALPVFIRSQPASAGAFATRMYMDAGLRNGVFLQEVLQPGGAPKIEAAAPPARFNTTIIVNGALALDDKTVDSDAKWAREWSLLSLVGRTKDMLVNQIYEFSVRRVREFGAVNGEVRVRTARGYEAHGSGGTTCKALQAAAAGAPFPPPFMQCLIDFGRAKGAATEWEFVSRPGGAQVVAARP